MKNRAFTYLTLVFFISLSCKITVKGQEGGFNYTEENHQEANYSQDEQNIFTSPEREGAGIIGPEKALPQKKVQQKKTAQPAQTGEEKPSADPVTEDKTTDEDSDSVLSFNFLHYIIQKFKFSDLIDK